MTTPARLRAQALHYAQNCGITPTFEPGEVLEVLETLDRASLERDAAVFALRQAHETRETLEQELHIVRGWITAARKERDALRERVAVLEAEQARVREAARFLDQAVTEAVGMLRQKRESGVAGMLASALIALRAAQAGDLRRARAALEPPQEPQESPAGTDGAAEGQEGAGMSPEPAGVDCGGMVPLTPAAWEARFGVHEDLGAAIRARGRGGSNASE